MYEQFLAISFALIVSVKADQCPGDYDYDCEYGTQFDEDGTQFDDTIYTYEQTPQP